MKLTVEYLSQLGVSDRLLSDISEEFGDDFQLLPENIRVLSEGDFPLERLLKPIVQSDDFSSEHPLFQCCIEFAPKSILSCLGDDLSPAILEELILREPVFALQRVIEIIPHHLFSHLLIIEPKATFHFARSRLQESDIANFCQEFPQIAIRYASQNFADGDLLRLSELDLVLAYEYAQERCISLGVDFSTLHHGREFDLVVDEFPSLKLPSIEHHYIARLHCDNCGQNSIRGNTQSLCHENGSKFDRWDCSCASCGTSTVVKFNIVIEPSA
tara:strand:- start:127 stop:942 length:816 start_codon:yes stop_codon:yes gene_type:complete